MRDRRPTWSSHSVTLQVELEPCPDASQDEMREAQQYWVDALNAAVAADSSHDPYAAVQACHRWFVYALRQAAGTRQGRFPPRVMTLSFFEGYCGSGKLLGVGDVLTGRLASF